MRLPKKIIVAPLNWGLGHATRCIPIVHELLNKGAEVLIASDGRVLTLLQKEFPFLTFLKLPAYNVEYKSNNMVLNIAVQLPKIFRAIRQEHKVINRLVLQHNISGIISDNRFGCYSASKRSVFLSHQLNIKIGSPILERMVNFCNRLSIHQFDECWIPDTSENPSLSGELSHPLPRYLSKKSRYVGPLSRMEWKPSASPNRYEAVAVLSGPEPQRTKLETLVIEQLEKMPGSYLVVQGKPEVEHARTLLGSTGQVTIVPSMTAAELNEAILQSSVFIGRSGYSTVMDLVRLRKPALLIPTPGQTEQEYLARKLHAEGYFYTQSQSELNLSQGIKATKMHAQCYKNLFDGKAAIQEAVENFLNTC